MLTEQEAVARLNEKIEKNQVKPSSRRFLDKIAVLQSRLTKQRAEMEKLAEQIKSIELENQQLQGAISVLLELAAEDEGMLEDADKLSNSTK